MRLIPNLLHHNVVWLKIRLLGKVAWGNRKCGLNYFFL